MQTPTRPFRLTTVVSSSSSAVNRKPPFGPFLSSILSIKQAASSIAAPCTPPVCKQATNKSVLVLVLVLALAPGPAAAVVAYHFASHHMLAINLTF